MLQVNNVKTARQPSDQECSTGYYTRDDCHIDLLRLCSFAKVRMIHAEVVALNIAKQEIHCSDGRPPIYYDVLSINVGITPNPIPAILQWGSGTRPLVTPVKPIDGFCARWDKILESVISAVERIKSSTNRSSNSQFTIAVVGGGAGGVELCAAIHHRLQSEIWSSSVPLETIKLRVILLTRGKTILASHGAAVQNIVSRLLAEKKIEVFLQSEITSVEVFHPIASQKPLLSFTMHWILRFQTKKLA
jgi:selenide,water dikinase